MILRVAFTRLNNYTALSGEEDHQYTQVGSRAIGGRVEVMITKE